ncbi:hypothetical protein N7451_008218 [Penicillium sp. IBT 35674x]|nr:hypothetical protein N7451_008218 [Penicillium sp. IBT 35674x]
MEEQMRDHIPRQVNLLNGLKRRQTTIKDEDVEGRRSKNSDEEDEEEDDDDEEEEGEGEVAERERDEVFKMKYEEGGWRLKVGKI